MGRQYADQVDANSKLIKDPVVTEYVKPPRPEPGPELRFESSLHH